MESPAKHVILVLSGKGGVGKSTIATQLALSLVENKQKVGVLDVDLCGPSIPRMLNVEGQDVHQCPTGWVPVYTSADKMLSVMSIGFLLDHKDDAVVWRGPKKNAMIKQFLTDVVWEDLDYLIIDTPPEDTGLKEGSRVNMTTPLGTSDEHISVVEGLKQLSPDGAVVVTTPQGVALADVRRELSFCRKTSIKVLGIVENMSGYTCPHCSECTNLFSKGGGQDLASEFQIPFLGQVPLDPQITQCTESGKSFVDSYKGTPTQLAMTNITKQLLSLCNSNNS